MAARFSSDDRLRRFPDETDARRFALTQLLPHFELYEEVTARGFPDDTAYRLDAVSLCPERGYLLGWEFKRSHLFKAEFTHCLRQAIYYRMAMIADGQFPRIDGRRVDACIVFPAWDGVRDDGSHVYAGEARGMLLLASHFRVGALTLPRKREGASIVIGESGVWHSWSGWTGTAAGVLSETRPLASQRRRDPARG